MPLRTSPRFDHQRQTCTSPAPANTSFADIFFNNNTYTGGTLLLGGTNTLQDLGQFSAHVVGGRQLRLAGDERQRHLPLSNRTNTGATITLTGATLGTRAERNGVGRIGRPCGHRSRSVDD